MTYHINTMQLIEAHNRHFFFARFDSVEGNGPASIAFSVECTVVGRAAASRQPFDRSKTKPVLAVKNMLNISKDKICNDV